MQKSLLLLAVGLLACSSVTQSPGTVVAPDRRQTVSIDRATWQARATFDSAARAGDINRMAALFTEDAILITARGDSIRGRDAIARYLPQLRQDATSANFRWAREGSLTMCVESARERLSYTAHIISSSGAADTVAGNLSVFWKRDSSGALKVAWAALSEREIRRRFRRSECPSVEDSVWGSWRLAVNIFPVPGIATTTSKGSFESVLRARGWVDASCVCTGDPPNTPLSKRTGVLAPGLVSIQYHLRRHMIAEIVGGRTPKGWTMGAQTFANRDYAQTRLSYSGTFVGALLSYEQYGVQLGVGPALHFARWALQDSLVPFSTGGSPSTTEVTWSQQPIGIVGDARYHRLLGHRVFAAFRGQIRRFRETATPSTPRFPPATIDHGSSFLGVGLGLVF